MNTLEETIQLTRGAIGDSGTCSTDKAIEGINEARRLLWNKLTGANMCEYFCICCSPKCLTLPSRYEKILLAWSGNVPLSLTDEWFQSYIGSERFDCAASIHSGINEIGGLHVVFRDYTVAPYLLGVMAESQVDLGQELSFEVINKIGSHQQIKIVIGQPPIIVESDTLITAIIRVAKKQTTGRVRVYAVDKTNDQKLLLAVYQPQDVNPQFRRFRLPGNCKDKLTVYAKKKFFKLTDLSELVEFTPDAIYNACLAVNARNNRNPDEFFKYLSLAVQEENKEIEEHELPTCSPLNIMDFNRPESLSGNYAFDRSDYYDYYRK
jgi:hypothetical protein